tara:strand:- start:16407 stop:16808 length:402 start_codon:yes stop_codon:yes gene_type:complete
MLPVMAHVAVAHNTAATNHNSSVSHKVSDLGVDRSTTVKSVSNASGTLSKIAVFCFSNSAWDNASLTRLASSSRKFLNIVDMGSTPFSHGMCRIRNRAECGKALKNKLLVNAALKTNKTDRVSRFGEHTNVLP